jgi:uroporphyrinogen decarboxylase
MNSIQRHQLALANKEADRVPVAPSFLTRAARAAGIRQIDYHTDPELLAEAQIQHCERFDFDGLFISSDNVILYEALGGKIFFPDENSYPFWTDPLIIDREDLVKYKIPDPNKDGRLPVLIEAAKIAMERSVHKW